MKQESHVVPQREIMGSTNKTLAKLGVTVEPYGFLFVTATVVQTVVTQNLYLYKACTTNFGYNATDCDVHNQTLSPDSQNNSLLIEELQRYVCSLNIFGTMIGLIPSAFIILFLGPFSDRHGRKILMIAPLIGYVLSTLIYMANYYAYWLPAEFLLFADLPVGFLGSLITFVMAVNIYIVDITSKEKRTLRLAVMAGTIAMAVPISQFISVPIYDGGGYLAIWLTSLGLYGLALAYVIFFLKDSRGKQAQNGGELFPSQPTPITTSPLEEALDCCVIQKQLWQSLSITFQPRTGYKRASVSLLMACLSLNLFSVAKQGIAYLYTRRSLSWNQPDFAIYSALFASVQVLGTLLVLPLLTGYLGLADSVIGVLSLIGSTCSHLLIAFVTSALVMYLSSLGHLLTLGTMVVIRSMLSKIVNSDELSSVYAVAAFLESFVPVVAVATFHTVYRATFDTVPGAIFILETVVEIIILILFIIVLILQRKDEKYNRIQPTNIIYYLEPEIRSRF